MKDAHLQALDRLMSWTAAAPAFRSFTLKLGITGVYVRLAHANQEPAVRATGESLGSAVDQAMAEWEASRDPLLRKRPATMGFIALSEFADDH